MKKIKLFHYKTAKYKKFALVSDCDYDRVNKYNWSLTSKHRYAGRGRRLGEGFKSRWLMMHRFVLGLDGDNKWEVDHINGNKLDNRRENLRICTHRENNINDGKPKNNTSGYKGVSWHKGIKKWVAQINVTGRNVRLGSFTKKEDAAIAYNEAAKIYHGVFANINEINV